MDKDKLLCASLQSMSVQDRIKRFNTCIHEFAEELVKEGICVGYEIKDIPDDISLLILDKRPLRYNQLSNIEHQGVAIRYFALMYSCGVTDDDFEESKGGFKWLCEENIMDKEELMRAANKADTEDKFAKFRRLVIELADAFVKEGVCNGYTLEDKEGGTMPLLMLDARPLKYGQISNEKHHAVAKRYSDLMYSCGITDEEFEYAKGGFDWLCVSNRR